MFKAYLKAPALSNPCGKVMNLHACPFASNAITVLANPNTMDGNEGVGVALCEDIYYNKQAKTRVHVGGERWGGGGL
jgi:hypothetical protein